MPLVVDSALKSRLAEVLARHPVTLAYLYGSAATGKMTPLSDVDIALVVDESRVAPADRLHLELAVGGQIADRCDIREADVRVINHAPLMFRGEVVTFGILLYCRNDEARVEFETRTRSEYFDFLPLAEAVREAHLDYMLKRGLSGKRQQDRRPAAQP